MSTRSALNGQIRADLEKISKDHLAGLLRSIVDSGELSLEMLQAVARNARPPARGGGAALADGVATLAELALGMVYREPEGKRQWMRIVKIGPVENFDSSGSQQYRNAAIQPAFSHAFVAARLTRIYGYDRGPFAIKISKKGDVQ